MDVAAPDCDVLICGLGPAGLLLANLLGQQGVRVIAIDAEAEPYALPRAAVIDDEVLRILQDADLAGAALADAEPQDHISFVTAAGRTLKVMNTAHGNLGHPPLVSVNQPALEETLRLGIARHATVALRRPVRLETIDRRADHVTAWVRTPEGGPRTPITARWLVGCDGASSTVRQQLAIGFGGSTFAQRWIVVDALCDRPLARVPGPHFVGDPARPTVCVPMSPGRHRWEWMLHPGEDPAPFLEPTRIRELVAPWLDGERIELERAVVYTFHARHADAWRRGRVVLAGDAAHVSPPFAGQGLSSGARDVANLAWKLPAVLAGAPDALMDTYETERRPHVAAMVNLAIRWGGIVQTTNPRTAAVRDGVLTLATRSEWVTGQIKPLPAYARGAFARRPARAPWRRGVGSLFPQPRVVTPAGELLLDDALGAGWTAITRSREAAGVLDRAGVRPAILGRDLDDDDGDTIGAWLDRHRSDWVVLRPDRFVFACGPAGRVGDATAALRRTLGPRRGSSAGSAGARLELAA